MLALRSQLNQGLGVIGSPYSHWFFIKNSDQRTSGRACNLFFSSRKCVLLIIVGKMESLFSISCMFEVSYWGSGRSFCVSLQKIKPGNLR